MLERRPYLDLLTYTVLTLGVIIIAFPVYLTVVASTMSAEQILAVPMPVLPGGHFIENIRTVLGRGVGESANPVGTMMWNSFIMAMGIAVGKISISILSAFAVVYFRFPFRRLCFWMIFITLMLPIEVRIMPTYQVVSDLGMLNSYGGLIIPIIASATATFLFRQFFMTVPDELTEAARIDGAGPLRFFKDILLPLSRTTIAALFVIQFIYGWNQYLWPLLITTDKSLSPVVVGVTQMISRSGDAATDWNLVMTAATLAMLPPALVVLLMQRWFVKGLVDSEK
ncbi:sn-glycerol-3-phosphate ABC transporter permease UgpE [Tolumonas lignilytica]|jgi:ABC-type sugar transport system, permease component|uniref:sn-glycerol-3-phosphate ABC transporter permease UgpE n=1 Tax=Tolumonas lignilytica TaxID=1283284 RepID=UPI0004665BCE|nr:sn-glycerol-3-phosphate ABC transporter permease UgpE [Tolumonas lignilytica]